MEQDSRPEPDSRPLGWEQLIQDAEAGMTTDCHAVPVWRIPGFYDDREGHWAAKLLMEADAQAAYATALAYRLTGERRYATKAAELLDGWASVNRAFAENDGPLVSAYLGTGLLRAALLLKPFDGWTAARRAAWARWLTDVCLPAWDGIPGRNNWWNWSLLAQLTAYAYLEDMDAFRSEVEQLKAFLDASLDEEGFLPEETVRGANGMWYHYFALAPSAAAAGLIRDVTGEDLYRWQSPRGRSLKRALDRLFHYVDGRADEWPFAPEQNVPAPAPDTWPAELYEAMAGIYADADYERFAAPHRPVVGHRNPASGYYLSYAWVYPTLLKHIRFPTI
ncbi:alginate lyase family protein [Cohnella fermenti]|uniref:Alginate lyase domain-containing protein n=1 Tax=Cohnella fermenti TaxID=2565925 RepID=A0A4S4BG88_9BACL|nr:alginate lyase family protein [Cohnella fermenti]THF73443.1 hypothetical protein E6C55_29075 [Cohnella fermenti]